MTRWQRLGTVLITLAVLAAVPATVLGAAPNQLTNGRVSPGAGSTTTNFGFSVHYSSDKDFAATSVVALVAGRTVTLRLSSGTNVHGTYSGSSTLPAGTWPVTFEAQASQGPGATLAGPTVTVSAPAPAPAPAPPAPAATPVPVTPAPVTPAPVTPAPVTPPPPTSAPTSTAAPLATTAATPSAPAPTAAGATSAPTATLGAAGAGTVDGMHSGPTPRRTPDAQAMKTEPGVLAWIVAVAGVGTVAMFAVLARRRKRGQTTEPIAPAEGGRPSDEIRSLGVGDALPRPVVLHQVEDPILSAMGLGRPAATGEPVEAPLTRSVRRGPGERIEPSEGKRARRR